MTIILLRSQKYNNNFPNKSTLILLPHLLTIVKVKIENEMINIVGTIRMKYFCFAVIQKKKL